MPTTRRSNNAGAVSPTTGAAATILALTQGLLLSVLVTMLGSGLCGLVISLTNWEGTSAALQSINYLSIAVGGLLAGRLAGKTGWMHGGLVGLLYMLVANMLLSGEGIAGLGVAVFSLRLLAGFLAGAIGGMLGVNTR